tara:strand:+ start:8118 stop:9032 length:915 start_codon:yes stop_codon:yes gene_type:complete
MPELFLPINITYDTRGLTPVRDVISALKSADELIRDASSLIPSLVPNSDVQLRGVSVKRLSQESPLREILVATLWVSSQDDIEVGVTTAIKAVAGYDVPDSYQTLLSLAVVLVLFYGVELANNLITKAVKEGPARRQLNAIIADMAQKTGQSTDAVKRILESKYSKPGLVKTLVRHSLAFFIPSKREGSARIQVGDVRIEPEIVNDVPFTGQVDEDQDFTLFKTYDGLSLSLHAQDMDKSKTGWAAVPDGITDRRLKLKLITPVEPSQLWGKSKVIGDVVIISKMTSRGYEPAEIHLSSIIAAE